jgi:formylglycine-generating enzyme required for sulfatase activity
MNSLSARFFRWLFLVSFSLTAHAESHAPLGLRDSAPVDERSVPLERGCMVGYKAKIPGTNVEFEMVPIPGGLFHMGSREDESGRNDDEGPQIQVEIAPFWMGTCEVTWAEYKQFMRSYQVFKNFVTRGVRVVTPENTVDSVTSPTPLYEPDFTFELGDKDRQPAVTVTHYAAKQYTKWLSGMSGTVYRLPTEAEWEYACRAGTQTRFSFGDDADQLADHAWYFENSDEAYHEVRQKKPNPWGLHDMHGNVAEICVDQYKPDAYASFTAGPVSFFQVIQWTTDMFPHVVRGGSWDKDADSLRCAARSHTEDWREKDPNIPLSPWWFTDEPARAVGFRIVRPLREPDATERQKFWMEDSEALTIAVDSRLTEGRGVRGLVDPDLPAAEKEFGGQDQPPRK